jgi:predicted naringenin-chalcone synthase
MNAVLSALATANPKRYATQEEIYAFLVAHFEMQPDEKELYRQLLMEGPIRGRYMAVDVDEEICSQDPDRLIQRFTTHSRRIGAEAARVALNRAGLEPAQVEGLIVNTCTGYLCPGLSSYLVEDLGLPPFTSVLDLMGMGCGGAIPNLEAACRMIQSGARKTVLCLSVEVCSATFFLGPDPDLIVSNSIFADGAAAAVLQADPSGPEPLVRSVPVRAYSPGDEAGATRDERQDDSGIPSTGSEPALSLPKGQVLPMTHGLERNRDPGNAALLSGSLPRANQEIGGPGGRQAHATTPPPSLSPGLLRFLDFESVTLPRYREQLRYTSRQGRLRNVLTRNVPVIGARAVAQVVHRLLDRRGLTQDAIDWWVVHPGGTQVLNAVQRQIGLAPERLRFSYEVFRNYGNMSSPSVLFVLDRVLREARPQPGATGLLLAFGAGFTAFAALVEFC